MERSNFFDAQPDILEEFNSLILTLSGFLEWIGAYKGAGQYPSNSVLYR